MTRATKPFPPPAAPRMARLPMGMIDEPPLPIRESMDETKLRELQESMAQLGLLQPILVVPREDRYEIVAGHRRWMAARELGWSEIPTIIYHSRGIAAEAAKVHENAIREDVTAAEEAIYFRQLTDDYTLDETALCALVHRSPDYVADRLRLLRGGEEVFQALRERKISFAVARELNKITDPTMRVYYCYQAVAAGCSSRVVVDWVKQWRLASSAPQTPAPALPPVDGAPAPDPYVMACEFCGGSKDPYNLVSIWVHRWELRDIKTALERAAKGDGK